MTTPDVETMLLDWTRQWFDLLAAGRIDEACAQLDEPNSYGASWSPGALVMQLHQTFSPETRFGREHPEGPRFTSPRTATGRERHYVGHFDSGSGFWFHYDVPLNGEFSDLTAQFEFHWRAPHLLAVRLHDLLVM